MKQIIRINENQLKKIVTESVNCVLNEIVGDGTTGNGYYKGVYIGNLTIPEHYVKEKIDECLEKGWSIEKIQRAIDDLDCRERTDYMYRW